MGFPGGLGAPPGPPLRGGDAGLHHDDLALYSSLQGGGPLLLQGASERPTMDPYSWGYDGAEATPLGAPHYAPRGDGSGRLMPPPSSLGGSGGLLLAPPQQPLRLAPPQQPLHLAPLPSLGLVSSPAAGGGAGSRLPPLDMGGAGGGWAPSPAPSHSASPAHAWVEPRTISPSAAAMLAKAVCSVQIAASDGLRLQFTRVPRCTGVPNVVYSQGKPRPGWEYNMSARWELLTISDGSLNASGMLDIFDVAGTDADAFSRMHIIVDYVSPDSEKSRCEKLVHDVADDLRIAIRRWADLLMLTG